MVTSPAVVEEDSTSDEGSGKDGALLRAVARVPPVPSSLAMAELPAALREAFGTAHVDSQALPRLGSIVDGRYRIDERLGAGGMGVVYAATHLQTLKSVALKWMHDGLILRSHSERVSARRRFQREAQIAARVRHPNLVDVYDASSDEQRSYLVMERLRGETLGARMKRGVLSWDELLTLIVPTLRGVSALHAQGVIHRDLKPENIFLAQDTEGSLCPTVLDFGVAALGESDAAASDETLTRPGAVIGTPGYMPLEQLRGERALDARTDVYALGVVVYEALAGVRPFQARNAAEHAALLVSQAPPALGQLVPSLRGPRAAAVMRAIARDPSERYPTVEAFARALLAAQPVSPRRSRRFLLSVGAIVSVGLAVWVAETARQAEPRGSAASSSRPAAAQPRAQRSESAQESARRLPAGPSIVPPASEAQLQAHEPATKLEAPSSLVSQVTTDGGVDTAIDNQRAVERVVKHSSARSRVAPHVPIDRATRLAQEDF